MLVTILRKQYLEFTGSKLRQARHGKFCLQKIRTSAVLERKARTEVRILLPELYSFLKINPIGLLSTMLQFQENKELSIPKNRIGISQCNDQDRNSRYKKRWQKTKQS